MKEFLNHTKLYPLSCDTDMNYLEQQAKCHKKRIVKEAAGLFYNFGIKEVTLTDVANAAGVLHQTVLQCFYDKKGLVEAVVDYTNAEIINSIKEIKDSVEDAIVAICWIYRFILIDDDDQKIRFHVSLKELYPDLDKSLMLILERELIKFTVEFVEKGKLQHLIQEEIEAYQVGKSIVKNLMILCVDGVWLNQIDANFRRKAVYQNVFDIATSEGQKILNAYYNQEFGVKLAGTGLNPSS